MKFEEINSNKICIFYYPLDKLQIGGVHMDNKSNKSLSNFFKKEGFYLILFICLCIVATVAVITTRSNKSTKNPPVAQQNPQVNKGSSKTVAQNGDQQKIDYDNALQVKKEQTAERIAKMKAQQNASQSTASAVSSVVDTKFIKPVEGTLGRAFSEDPVKWVSYDNTTGISNTTWRPNPGIDIKASLGTAVVAALSGKVEKIDTTDDGVEIIINHQNGLKTVYSNLDPAVSVKVGDTVKKGQKIGKVGNTTLRAAYESYGNHLHFEVIKDNKNIDPEKYVKY